MAGNMRAGDWNCPFCQNHNFASRSACNKCGGARPAEAGPAIQRGTFGSRPGPYDAPGGDDSGATTPGRSASGGSPEMKEGDWLCPKCNNHNFASRVNCNKCGELKDGMRPGDWVCRSCKNHNFAKQMQCKKCGAPRHSEQGGKGMMGMGGSGGKGMMGMGGSMGGGQQIGNGLIVMPNGLIQMGGGGGMMGGKGGVGMMGGKGGLMGGKGGLMGGKGGLMGGAGGMGMAKGMKEGDWLCPACSNHNFASRSNCNKCQMVRPGFKQGDWICTACKNHNFASRDDCKKCGQPKNLAAGPATPSSSPVWG